MWHKAYSAPTQRRVSVGGRAAFLPLMRTPFISGYVHVKRPIKPLYHFHMSILLTPCHHVCSGSPRSEVTVRVSFDVYPLRVPNSSQLCFTLLLLLSPTFSAQLTRAENKVFLSVARPL